MKSLGLSSKGSTNAKICLKENEIAHFEPKETSSIFRKFYENLAQSLVDKLPACPRYLLWRKLKNIMMNLIFRTA